ncbi:hypothetical protein Tco_0725822 [Tanacetum coccineum]|uniref:Uncharacterized protein n=1 Tax=Tanacetum coccineum TaxID=301880 RepID=A0ABQ4YEV8_9ASTR
MHITLGVLTILQTVLTNSTNNLYWKLDIDPEIQAEIDKYVSYADALRARGIDARVVVEAVDREEIEASTKGPVEVRVDRVTHPIIVDDILEPSQEGAVEVTYEALGDLVQRTMPNTRFGASRTREEEEVSGDGGNGNGGNGNEGNGNSNGNGGGYGYNFGGYMLSRECTYQDCLKCHPLNFNGTEGVVGNSYKRTIGIEAAYAMSWAELMKLMT